MMILSFAKLSRRKIHPMTVVTARIPMVRSSSRAVGNAERIVSG